MARHYADRLAAGLIAQGYTERERRGRYRVFDKWVSLNGGPVQRIIKFVGVNGALRGGRSPSDSRSFGDPARQTDVYRKFLTAGDAVLDLAKNDPATVSGLLTNTALDF